MLIMWSGDCLIKLRDNFAVLENNVSPNRRDETHAKLRTVLVAWQDYFAAIAIGRVAVHPSRTNPPSTLP
jgi:hypothetical protein